MTVNQQKNRKRNCTGKAYFSRELLVKFVRIIGLVRVFFKKLFGNFLTSTYAVARTEHDALVKSTTKIFSNFVAKKPKLYWYFLKNLSFKNWPTL